MTKIKIFTWNFGNQSKDKLECITNQLFKEKDTIYVVGLQEVTTSEINSFFGLSINKYLTKKSEINGYKITYGQKSTLLGFDLLTFIIYPEDIALDIKKNRLDLISNTKSIAASSTKTMPDTKGYLWINLTINSVDITIVNVHLPFEDEEFSLQNFQMLNDTFKKETNVIIFGDYNTRSKVDDTCFTVENCNVKFIKNAEGNVSELENNLNNCETKKNCDQVKDVLIKYDYLNQTKQTMIGYTEAPIVFLPSYKINKDGNYDLKKKEKKRLAGYADRILVKGENLEIIEESYKMIHCLGNDHFPLMLDVKIKSSPELTDVLHNDQNSPELMNSAEIDIFENLSKGINSENRCYIKQYNTLINLTELKQNWYNAKKTDLKQLEWENIKKYFEDNK